MRIENLVGRIDVVLFVPCSDILTFNLLIYFCKCDKFLDCTFGFNWQKKVEDGQFLPEFADAEEGDYFSSNLDPFICFPFRKLLLWL